MVKLNKQVMVYVEATVIKVYAKPSDCGCDISKNRSVYL